MELFHFHNFFEWHSITPVNLFFSALGFAFLHQAAARHTFFYYHNTLKCEI